MDYAHHPSFRFDESSWTIPRIAVDNFHATYQQLRKLFPAKYSLENAKAQLRSIMECLASQAETPEEHEFVAELHQHVDCLLDDEFSHYRNCRPARPPSVPGAVNSLHDLRRQRFTTGCLDMPDVEALWECARPHVSRFEAHVRDGRLTREDLSINDGSTIESMIAILNHAFRALGILDAISAYMDRSFVVGGMALEYSHHASTWWRHTLADLPAPQSMYAHLDETIGSPKAIVYLSDVDRGQGPTSCYPGAYEQLALNALQELIGRVVGRVGNVESSRLKAYYAKPYHQSMGSPAFRRHFMRLPPALRFNSHFGWDVLPGSSLEADLANREEFIVGPKGTFVAFDGGRLLHRGGLIEQGSRVAMQVIFSPEPKLRTVRRVKNAIREVLRRPRRFAKALFTSRQSDDASTALKSFSKALPPVCCIDVGASYFPHEKWRLFLDSPHTHWIAVEPNQQNAGYIRDWRWRAMPQLVGTGLSREGGTQILNVTNVDSGSSLFPPVIGGSMQHRVTDVTYDYFFPVREVPIETLTLTDVIDETATVNPVLVKLDTQGSELSILQGAHDRLSSHRCVGIEIESTLLAEPLMRGSAHFWQVCEYLQSLGFELMHIDPFMGPSRFSTNGSRGRRWLNECDSVFMLRRDVARELPAPYRLTLLAFQLAYDFFEEALSLLQDDADVRGLLETEHLSPTSLETAIRRQL